MRIASALAVVVCVGFAARAAAHAFDDEPAADPLPPAAPAPTPKPAIVEAVGAGDPAPLPVLAPEPAPAPAPVIPARSTLVLVATSVGDRPQDSFATLLDPTIGTQGAYWVGQRVSGIGTLEKVSGTYALIRNDGGAVERVEFPRTGAPAAEPAKPAAVATAAPAKAAPEWAARVNKIDDSTYEVDRSLVKELVNAGANLPGVRVTPALTKDGKLQGVRVARSARDSLAAGVGLRTGDIIQAIDGTALDSTDAVLEMYGRLDSTSVARVSILRGGKPVELELRLR